MSGHVPALRKRPQLRGVSHEYAFYASLGPGIALIATADGTRERAAATIYALCAAAMFGMSALYHRITWTPQVRRRLARLDHATVYLMIAGSFTPAGLLVLHGTLRVVVLAVVWGGAGAGIALKTLWVSSPKWIPAVLGLSLGAMGLVAIPQLTRVGAAGLTLLLVGGGFYAAGAVVYALRRPDPIPTVFGYHEIFHALVVVAVALQYVAIAFFVIR